MSTHRRAQATTDYMLVLSALVIALAAAAWAFMPAFREGVDELRDDVGLVLSSGTRDGSGDRR